MQVIRKILIFTVILLCVSCNFKFQEKTELSSQLVQIQGIPLSNTPNAIESSEYLLLWDNIGEQGVMQLYDPQDGKLLDEENNLPYLHHLRFLRGETLEAIMEGMIYQFTVENGQLDLLQCISISIGAPYGYDYNEDRFVYADQEGLKLQSLAWSTDELLFDKNFMIQLIKQEADAPAEAAPYFIRPRFVGTNNNVIAALLYSPMEQTPVTGLFLFNISQNRYLFTDFISGGDYYTVGDNSLMLWHDHKLEQITLSDMRSRIVDEIEDDNQFVLTGENGGVMFKTFQQGSDTILEMTTCQVPRQKKIGYFHEKMIWVQGASCNYILLKSWTEDRSYLLSYHCKM